MMVGFAHDVWFKPNGRASLQPHAHMKEMNDIEARRGRERQKDREREKVISPAHNKIKGFYI